MEEILQKLNNVSLLEKEISNPIDYFTNGTYNNYILKDLYFIADCYLKGITDIDFSDSCQNIEMEESKKFPEYQLLYLTLKEILKKHYNHNTIYIDDEILLFSYLDYYHEHLSLSN